MAKGASKLAGGGGAQQAQQNATSQNPVMDNLIKNLATAQGTLTATQANNFGSQIYAATEVGDQIIFSGNRPGDNQILERLDNNLWGDIDDPSVSLYPYEVAKLVFARGNQGTWSFKESEYRNAPRATIDLTTAINNAQPNIYGRTSAADRKKIGAAANKHMSNGDQLVITMADGSRTVYEKFMDGWFTHPQKGGGGGSFDMGDIGKFFTGNRGNIAGYSIRLKKKRS